MSTTSFGGYLRHAWNAFRNKDPIIGDVGKRPPNLVENYSPGMISYKRPDLHRLSPSVDRTIISSIYSRIATDVCIANIRHVKTDINGTFQKEMKSGLNYILRTEANKDQTGRAFMFDFVLSMLDEGVVAGVPVDTSIDPTNDNVFDIVTMRTGKITQWEPDHVRLDVYNDTLGRTENIRMPKRSIAIVENPFYYVMNEPNSTMRRLAHKLALMDTIDDEIGSKKLDVIIQLPYVIKNKTKMEQAEERRKQLEEQLETSKLGVGYIDGTERVVQLNRSLENNLMAQVEYLTSMLYGQLGITKEIMEGTASEDVMMNYYKRTIDVILTAICEEFERKFLSKTARSQNQAIQFYREPFSLTPTSQIADIADKFTRNEILSPNEVRGIVGFMPSKDEAANELRNRNINQSGDGQQMPFAMTGEGGEAEDAPEEEGAEPGASEPMELDESSDGAGPEDATFDESRKVPLVSLFE